MTPIRQTPTSQLLDYNITYQVIFPPKVGAPIASYPFSFHANMTPAGKTTVTHDQPHFDYRIEPA
ncbi:hypothetical protein CLM62_02980 [Streptomyces sp. SA15]|nr:hypothetical protein CLM62_02980 [Streptomyces sp. SA15]